MVRSLQPKVRKGKELSWAGVQTQDVSRKSIDSFIHVYDLPGQSSDNIQNIYNDHSRSVGPDPLHEVRCVRTLMNDDNSYSNISGLFGATDAKDNVCGVVAPAVLILTECYKTDTSGSAAKTKMTLTFNVVRWDGEEFVLDAAFKGRKKMVKGKRVFAKTKAHRLTKLYIWRRDEDALDLGAEVEKIKEKVWRLRSKTFSLANLAAIKSPPECVKVAKIGECLFGLHGDGNGENQS